MGAGHGHGQSVPSGHAGSRHRWRLAVSFVLILGFFLVELAAALWSGSLALISDAGHMAADVVALGAALTATRIATRPDRTGRRTFGSYRTEIFASGFTALVMLGMGVYVATAAIGRISQSAEVQTEPMVLVGLLGLAVNLAALVLLRNGAKESLNVKGAYLEVVADSLGSVGVIAAGLLVARTGEVWWDTLIALAIAAFIAVRAVVLAREVLAVLGQHAPASIDPTAVEQALRESAHVEEVHDLHLWTLTSGMHVATAHVVTVPGSDTESALAQARATLRDDFHIEHATVQIESNERSCRELSW